MAGLPKGQREQLLLFAVFIAAALIFADWNWVFKPRSTELAAQRDRVEKLVALNDKAKAELGKGDIGELRRQLAEYQQTLSLIRTLVPSGNEVPALLEQVSTAARRVGLDLSQVKPQPVVVGESYDTYRYDIQMVGGYHQLAEFFTNMGALSRIVLPMNVSLAISTNQNALKSHPQDAALIEARFQLQTFVIHTGAAPDADLPPTTKGAKS
ncbi:MAG TPA: type 4a pilus biogenesis protein PilO [Gemmatimonadaceae bacterium]